MRILLIDPPHDRLIGFKSEWFPLGLTCLAAYLQEKGVGDIGIYHAEHESNGQYTSIVKYADNFHLYKEILDSDTHPVWDEVRAKIADFEPDVVGISVLTVKVPSALRIANICRELNPGIKTVFGGHHPTIRPDEMLSHGSVDFVVRGEGEETFHELLSRLRSGHEHYDGVPGLSFRANGGFVHNIDRELIRNIDELPMPARDALFSYRTYSPVQLSMVMTSRGCPYDCGFCASRNIWSKRVRFRSIDHIIEEIDVLKKRHDVKNITFMDDAFTINRHRVTELCERLIANRMDIAWSCLTRVDAISDELIALMRKAGCTRVSVGVESGNQRILDWIGKRTTLDKVREAAQCLRRNKMFWSGFFMFGFPTETEDEIRDTIHFLHELKPNWAHIGIFTPYPGTALFEPSVERGMISDVHDYTQYSHHNVRRRRTDVIEEEKFHALARSIFQEVHRYNSSYKALFRRALTRNYHKNPKLLVQDARKVVSWLKT